MKQFAVVIPSLNPGQELIHLIQASLELHEGPIIIVDDGSGSDHERIFVHVQSLSDQIIILHNDTNLGKGGALKTAFRYVLDQEIDVHGVVTADADGQHLPIDIVKVGDKLLESNTAFVLGARNFELDHVPFRSRLGNKITRLAYKLFFKVYFQDTQTGLRGIHRDELEWLTEVTGNRFEYEMNMLIGITVKRRSFREVEITTVYEEDHTSYYSTFRDSYHIGKSVLREYSRLKRGES